MLYLFSLNRIIVEMMQPHIYITRKVLKLDLRKDFDTVDRQFSIIGLNSINSTACYISVVYLDGYAYSPSEWLNYSRSEFINPNYDKLKGEKLGKVTLDLKGKIYTGIPPSFSSALDEGTEIYTVKNLKKERAILVIDDDYAKVSSVELRSEEDSSVIGVSENKQLLELINSELSKLPLLQSSELGKDPYSIGKRIAINLVFSNGVALHMQVIPEANSAYIFGGFIHLSKEFCSAVQEIPIQVDKH